jgi:hypothetical protein
MENQKEIIAFCGLFCNNCKSFKNSKCPGCSKNEKATWCATRKCCIENKFSNCSECNKFDNVKDCKKMNNVISKFFAFVFKSDRIASIEYLKQNSGELYINLMKKNNLMSVKKNMNK